MLKHKNFGKTLYILQALLLITMPFLVVGTTRADFLTSRSVKLKDPIASAVTDYTVKFTISTAAMLGSIQLQFCDNSPFFDSLCIAPAGMDVTAAVLAGQSGETGFSIDPSSTANNLILTRISSASLTGPVQYDFTGIKNPSTPNNTTYVRIMTYPSTDATGPRTDQGAATFATAGKFGTTAFVPPRLYFCVGVTVDAKCASTVGDQVSFGDLTPVQAAAVTTQFAAATNDPGGYVVYSLGTTMTSGNKTISALNILNPSIAGTGQFGINLRANNNPNKGLNKSGVGAGVVMPNYNTPDLFMFVSGDAIAQATQATDYNVYTATYIANVAPDQPIGVYATTISYMAVAQF